MELQEKRGGKILMKFFEIALREVKGKLQDWETMKNKEEIFKRREIQMLHRFKQDKKRITCTDLRNEDIMNNFH